MLKYLSTLLWQALLLGIMTLTLLITHSLSSPEPVTDTQGSSDVVGVSTAADENFEQLQRGKRLFKNNCASCHNKNMVDAMTGPALAGVTERWKDYPKEDLYRWIRNSGSLIQEGHKRAVVIWQEWDRRDMSPFPNLTDEEIEDMLAYIER